MRQLYWTFLLAFAVMPLGFWPSFTGAFGPLDLMREVMPPRRWSSSPP
jgi:hypothetical protein